MRQRIENLFRGERALALAALLIFSSVTLALEWKVGVAELAVAALLLLYYLFRRRRRAAQLADVFESVAYRTDSATETAMLSFPLSVAAFESSSGELIWANDLFWETVGSPEDKEGVKITELLPELPLHWLEEGKNVCPELFTLNGRIYSPEGTAVPRRGKNAGISVVYLRELTELEELRQEYADSRPVEMVIIVDNYEELMKPLTDRQRIELRGKLDDVIEKWCSGRGGLMRRFDRDRYMFIFEHRHLQDFTGQRFSLLDEIEQVTGAGGMHATASIGVGLDGAGFEESFSFASLAAEMAMSRGGDQAVVKNRYGFEFFGGRGAEVETRSAVHARVVAASLRDLIEESGQVYIMGHRYADLDTVGAAAGLVALCRKLEKNAALVLGEGPNASEPLLSGLWKTAGYENALLTPQEAMLRLQRDTLLIVVDTNRPEQVEDRALLESVANLAVIDHHRRADTFIGNAAVEYLEPFASSAGELVTELLCELMEPSELREQEADALLSGIAMDTKNFTIRSGERTFIAASWLNRAGADTTRVKILLQNGMEETVARYNIMRHAENYRGIAVAALEEPQNRVVASQAADELLNIRGITASVVFYPTADGGVDFSARSIGALNVQVLLEKLGGGGNMSAAGAQMKNITSAEAKEQLYGAIDEYMATE